MTRHIIGRAAFSGAVAVALVFGARAAAAAPAPGEAAAPACITSSDCRGYCAAFYPGSIPRCSNGQCKCLLY
jgi:hypothetical protein